MGSKKQRTKVEIFQEQVDLHERMREINTLAEREERELSPEEQREFSQCARKIELFEAEARSVYEELTPDKKRAVDIFADQLQSIVRSKNQTGQLQVREAGDPTIATDVNAITDDVMRQLLEPLQKALLVDKLGCKINRGVVGDVKYPSVNNVEASIMGETVEIVGQKLEFSEKTAEKRRVGVAIPFSYLSLAMANRDLIAYAFKIINQAVAQLINKWMFATTAISSASNGCFVEAAKTANLVFNHTDDAITWADVVALETEVTSKDLPIDGTTAYVVSPKVMGVLKTTEKSAGTGKYLVENGQMNGYPVLVSNHIGGGGVGFGVFNNVAVDEYAGTIIEIDKTPKKGILEVVYNGFWEITVERTEAFSYGTLTV